MEIRKGKKKGIDVKEQVNDIDKKKDFWTQDKFFQPVCHSTHIGREPK